MQGIAVGKTKVRVRNIFVMAYSRKVIFNYWESLNKNKVLKIIRPEKYLFISIKTLNSRKQIFRQECESTSFVKIILRKMRF